MNRASSATGWVRNPVMKSPKLNPRLASSYDLGWTYNPITGCLNGCEYCYARKLARGRLKSRYLANPYIAGNTDVLKCAHNPKELQERLADPFYPRFWGDRVLEFTTNKDRKVATHRGIFVCDMSDLFGIGIPEEWTRNVFDAIRCRPFDRFYLLTKQPQNLIKWSPFPPHCYVGVTITTDKMRYEALYWLKQIQASVKYLSIEPHLGRIQIAPIDLQDAGIGWIIDGAQTKPYKPPKIEWVEEIETSAKKAGIAIFEKDNLKPLLKRELIQELPK